MEKKTFEQLREQRLSANEKLGDIYMKAANRELTAEEQMSVTNLNREIEMCENGMRGLKLDADNAAINRENAMVMKNRQFRELIMDAYKTGQKRELLLAPASNSGATSPSGYISNSGAIELTIHEMIPTLHEGLGLPSSLRIVTGVTGNELWPVSVNDVEMEEVGEVVALSNQTLDFKNIQPVQRRIGLKVPVSNTAIDNAYFDLMAFVQTKVTIALRKYLAEKLYSQAAFTGNHGPFSNLTPAGTIDLGNDAYKNILKAVAAFSDKGFFEGNVTLIMDRETEAELKATPKLAGAAAGFVVENGLCAGYPYITTHYLNTKLNAGGTAIEPTDDKFIGIGYFEWFAMQQHGQVRLVVDPLTQADKNITRVILNSAWSFTDLSIYINGGDPQSDGDGGYTYPTQAFALYKIAADSSSNL